MTKSPRWLLLMAFVVGVSIWGLLTFGGPSLGAPKFTPRTQPNNEIQATVEYLRLNPVPPSTPVELSHLPGNTVKDSQTECVTLHQDVFWQQGTSREQLQAHLVWNTTLSVDNQRIITPYSQLAAIPIDEKGLPTDKWNAPLVWCFVLNLPNGEHLFNLTSKYLTGEVYSYSWIWIVGDE